MRESINRAEQDARSYMPSSNSSSSPFATSASAAQQQQQQQDYGRHHKERLRKLPKELRNILAGGIAGMVAKSVVAPFDRIKILFQISSAEFQISKIPRVAWKIVQEEGIQALWKGNTATMIRVFPYSGIQFMVYDRCKTYLLAQHEQSKRHLDEESVGRRPTRPKHWGLSPTESLVSGMMAGAVSVSATYPLDLTRAQLAVLRRKKSGSLATPTVRFHQVLMNNYHNRLLRHSHGLVGLFRGITPTILGILPYSGIAFAFNEQGKQKIQRMTGRDLTTMERMQTGALSGLFAQTLTYPLEVTRRRMQTIGIVATSGKDAAVDVVGTSVTANKPNLHAQEVAIRVVNPHHPPTMGTIVRELYAEQGVRGFFKGVSLNWFKGPIAFSISFTVFDLMQMVLETEQERRKRLPRRITRTNEEDNETLE